MWERIFGVKALSQLGFFFNPKNIFLNEGGDQPNPILYSVGQNDRKQDGIKRNRRWLLRRRWDYKTCAGFGITKDAVSSRCSSSTAAVSCRSFCSILCGLCVHSPGLTVQNSLASRQTGILLGAYLQKPLKSFCRFLMRCWNDVLLTPHSCLNEEWRTDPYSH